MAEITGSEIVLESLLKEGVEVVFGYPGGQILPFFDKLYSYGSKLKFYLPRHEQGGIHAADGYARATGKTGVVIATSGPGATNLVTGIATAYMDSVPIVAICGQVPTHLIGNDAFQEVDITGITRPITKHNFLAKNVKELAQIVKDAFYIASTGRPGPVLIDLPADVQRAMAEFAYPEHTSITSYKPTMKGNPVQIKKALEMIKASKKPVVYAGGGVIISNASNELRDFVDTTGIPVTTTLLGLGAYPEEKELSLHMLGMHGTQYANKTVTESDLIIAVGARFDDRVTGKTDEFAPHAKIIHIDIDPTSIGKSVDVDLPIVGDVKEVLKEMNKSISKCDIKEWTDHVSEMKKSLPLKYEKDKKVIKPQEVMEELYAASKGQAIIVTDVGQHQMWASQFYHYSRPRSFISSGGLGTMGYGLPAAMGAKVGLPKELVVCITGDGGIQMNIQELATISLYNIGVKIVIMNNTFLGMVRQWQELFYGRRYSTTYLQAKRENLLNYSGMKNANEPMIPDFCKVAEAYGIKCLKAEDPADLAFVIKTGLEHDGPVLMDIRVAPEENVLPMVPAGKPLTYMLS